MPTITPMPFTHITRNTGSRPWPLLCRSGLPLGKQLARRLPRR